MPNLERLVSVHQLISYPATALDVDSGRPDDWLIAIANAHRFNAAYENAEDLIGQAQNLREVYVVSQAYDNRLFFSLQVEENIGEGRPYQLTDIVAIVRLVRKEG
jgi:hypothetical protein